MLLNSVSPPPFLFSISSFYDYSWRENSGWKKFDIYFLWTLIKKVVGLRLFLKAPWTSQFLIFFNSTFWHQAASVWFMELLRGCGESHSWQVSQRLWRGFRLWEPALPGTRVHPGRPFKIFSAQAFLEVHVCLGLRNPLPFFNILRCPRLRPSDQP